MHRVLTSATIIAAITLGGAAATALTDTFEPVTYKNEALLDNCYTLGKYCGKEAADKWCKIQGYQSSKEFQLVKASPTKTLVGQRCVGPHCTAFKRVTCFTPAQRGKGIGWPQKLD